MYLKGTNYIYPCKVHFLALFEFYEFKVQKNRYCERLSLSASLLQVHNDLFYIADYSAIPTDWDRVIFGVQWDQKLMWAINL